LEDISSALVVLSSSGEIEYANRAAHEFFGDLASRDSPLAGTPPLERALAGEPVSNFELLLRNHRHPEGIWLVCTAEPRRNRDGRTTGAVAFLREITRDTSERADSTVQRLQAVFDHALDVVILANDSMRLVDANPSAVALLGYSRDELLTMTVADITSSEHREAVWPQWNAFLEAGTAQGELQLSSRNGSRIDVEFRAVANILPSLHLSVLRDISARKRAEATLCDTQRTESVGLLASGAAHDFNNLLVGIMGNASLALDQLPAEDVISTHLRDILAAGSRASKLSRQMLHYGSSTVPDLEPTNLSETVQEIGSLIHAAIPKQVEIEYQLGQVPNIDADSGQVQQVIMNLIINAGQAMFEQAPGKISVRTEFRVVREPEATPETTHLSPGEFVALEVEDTGRGMDETTRNRIFDPFFSTKVAGKGLGLAAVRRIVGEHGGAIWVRSAINRGTCFTVLFPVSCSIPALAPEPVIETVCSRSLRILVLDHERLVQKVAKAALESAGHSVTILADGRDALSLLASNAGHFDAVLLDLSLPGVSGKHLAREILEIQPAIKIVPSTGYPEAEARRWLEGIETAGFVQKPFTAAELKRALKEALA